MTVDREDEACETAHRSELKCPACRNGPEVYVCVFVWVHTHFKHDILGRVSYP